MKNLENFLLPKLGKVVRNFFGYHMTSEEERYYGKLLLDNLIDLMGLFLVAFILGQLWISLLTLGGFLGIRLKARGIHASSILACRLSSVLIFIGLPFVVRFMPLPKWTLIGIYLLCIPMLLKYAPNDTPGNPLIGPKLRLKLRLESLRNLAFIIGVSMFLPQEWAKFLALGTVTACLAVLPLTYLIFKKESRNYEKYERAYEENGRGCEGT